MAVLNRLPALTVSRAKRPGMLSDGGGLYLQVSRDGAAKSWIFRYAMNGREREMGLGSLDTVSLAEARELAETCRKLKKAGTDPIDARRAKREADALDSAKAMSFKQAADAYKHHAALPYAEMAAFMAALRSQGGHGAKALEFAILCAARTGEVISARWDEVDLDAAVWLIPATRMKAGREHRVALSKAAVTLLRSLAEVRVSDFIFPGAKLDAPLSNMALLATLRRMKRGDLTAHGFRSTFRDWAAERTNFPSEVAEMALAHAVSDRVEAAYRRGDLFDKRRKLAEAWASYCRSPAVANTDAGAAPASEERGHRLKAIA